MGSGFTPEMLAQAADILAVLGVVDVSVGKRP